MSRPVTHYTTIPFSRSADGSTSLFAAVTFMHHKALSEKQILSRVKKAVTKWVQLSSHGRKTWEYAGEDLNLGDFLSAMGNHELEALLEREGVHVISSTTAEPNDCVSYDETLIIASEIQDED